MIQFILQFKTSYYSTIMESFRLKKYKVVKSHYKLCWGIALPPPTRRRIGEISERSFMNNQIDYPGCQRVFFSWQSCDCERQSLDRDPDLFSPGSHSRLRRSQSQLRCEKKNTLAPRVLLGLPFSLIRHDNGSFSKTLYINQRS